MTNVEVFRPKIRFFYAAAVFAFAAGLATESIFYSDASTLGFDLSVATTAAAVAWLFFVRPKLELSDEGVHVVNPFRSITLGWGDVQDVETRFSLAFIVDGKRIGAWVAPANGRRRVNKQSIFAQNGTINSLSANDLKAVNTATFDGSSIIASDSPSSDSGLAAHLVRVRLSEFRTTGAGIDSSSKTNWVGLCILTAAAASAVVFALVH